MGMFDYIVCDFLLPGNPPSFIKKGHQFQTKDLDCGLNIYHIDIDGRFVEHLLHHFYGNIEFYSSNIVGSGPGVYTKDGEDAESVTYEATFADGNLVSVKETERKTEPALPTKSMIRFPKLTEKDKEYYNKRISESLVGKTIHVLYGGQKKGYNALVMCESKKNICIRRLDNDELEILNRSLRDHIFWDTEEEAQKNLDEKEKTWNAKQKEYDNLVKERNKKNVG